MHHVQTVRVKTIGGLEVGRVWASPTKITSESLLYTWHVSTVETYSLSKRARSRLGVNPSHFQYTFFDPGFDMPEMGVVSTYTGV